MKIHRCPFYLFILSVALFLSISGAFGGEQAKQAEPRSTTISVHATIPPGESKAPLFLSGTLGQTVIVSRTSFSLEAFFSATVLQGETSRFTLELVDAAAVENISGDNVLDWAVRSTDSSRSFLDINTKKPVKKDDIFNAVIFVERKIASETKTPLSVPLLGASGDGHAALSGTLRLVGAKSAETATHFKVVWNKGFLPVGGALSPLGTKEATFQLDPTQRPELGLSVGVPTEAVSMEKNTLLGKLSPDGLVFSFTLYTTIVVREAGAEIPLLSGDAAVSDFRGAEGLALVAKPLLPGGKRPGYLLSCLRAGTFPVTLKFEAKLFHKGDATHVDFSIPAAQIVPFTLEGFPESVQFASQAGVSTPGAGSAPRFSGFLPMTGHAGFSWTRRTADADALLSSRLFFSTEETTAIAVRPGLLRQETHFRYQILQGKLDTLRFALTGPGEILRVNGQDVLSWKIEEGEMEKDKAAPSRILTVRLASPKSGSYALSVDAQTPLGNFPVVTPPLGIAPQDGVRHGGFVLVHNEGAVRLEVQPRLGLAQVAPALFPEKKKLPESTQRFVYRVASAGTDMEIRADNILPEASVSLLALYQITENDLFIDVELELDVREAPLPEFTLRIPVGYTVSQTHQLDEWQYTTGPVEAGAAQRDLRLIFARPVQGRYLAQFRLEKTANLAFAATPHGVQAVVKSVHKWLLPPLAFPGAKSVRGHIGIIAAPGLRAATAATTGMADIATAFFPRKIDGLQQAFRLRDTDWGATMSVEKLDLVVQSDCLHLFAVREGMVSASTTVNYAIAGAPLGSFRFAVPAEARNMEFAGRDIRAWKRSGDIVEVNLHKPASGTFTLLGTYDLPLNPRGGELALPGLQPLGVQSEQGLVLAVSDLQFEVTLNAISGHLTVLEPGEIPHEYRLMFDAPLLAAYQYSGRPYKLQLGLVPRPRGDTINQVVDFASLQTRVARDGQLITEARYMVKSHGHQHLRVVVPSGLKLWTARVGDADVLPVMEGGETGHATALIPLPAHSGVNAIQQVDLRFGGSVAGTRVFHLEAPAPGAPVIHTRWELFPAAGMLLKASGGNLARQGVEKEAGMWFEKSPEVALLLFVALGLAVFGTLAYIIALRLRRAGHGKVGIALGLLATLASIAVLLALGLFLWPDASKQPEAVSFVFTAPVHLPGSGLFLELQDVSAGDFWAKTGLALLAIAALVIWLTAWIKKSIFLRAAAWTVLFIPGLLSDEPTRLAQALGLFFLVEIVSQGLRCFRAPKPKAVAMLMATLVAGASVACGATSDSVTAAPAAETHALPGGVAVVEFVRQTIHIRNGSAKAAAEMRVRGNAGDSFKLLDAPAVLTRCDVPEGTRIEKVTRNALPAIQLILDKPGVFLVNFGYEQVLDAGADSLRLPTGVATQDQVLVLLQEKDLQVSSDAAVSQWARAPDIMKAEQPVVSEGDATVAGFFFLPRTERVIRWFPQERDRRAESLVTYAETADFYTPSLGVLDGWHLVKIRPAQGLLSSVCLAIPEGLTIANVSGKHVGRWRFDPEKRRLLVDIEPGQANECALLVETQAGVGSLPRKLVLAPLAVEGAAGQVGMLAMGAGNDVQIVSVAPQKMLAVSNNDFTRAVASATNEKVPLKAGAIRHSFRYGGTAARLAADIGLLTPEVRVSTAQRFSLGEDRVSLGATWGVDITRAGVFRLSFELPESLEVESISGQALSHWTEIREKGRRIIVMHLRERTLGRQDFLLAFAGPGIAGKKTWDVPALAPREALRQTGELTLVPEEGLRLHVKARSGATQFDPGPSARLPKGAIAFRLAQSGWKLALEMESLAPWMQASYLQDVTVRDGQVRVLANFEYLVENAAAKTLRVRLPAVAESVRFSGVLVEDAVCLGPVAAKEGQASPASVVWEIRLQRRVIGKTAFQVTYQCPSTTGDTPDVAAVEALDAGLQHGWLALRTAGRLELKPVSVPPFVTTSDWQSVPRSLRTNLAEPAAVLRMVENAFTLPLAVATHDPAKLLAMRVEKAALQTMLSAPGKAGGHGLTRVILTARMAGKGLLRVTLPENAAYWHGFVNDEPVRVARDGEALLLPVAPNPVSSKPTQIEFFYAARTGTGEHSCKLEGPRFDVPLENITWQVYLPDGHTLVRHEGDLRLAPSSLQPAISRLPGKTDSGHIESYLFSNAAATREIETQAEALLQLGNNLRSQGNQTQALQALNLASTLSKGNMALNEDARVQLESLRTEQIEVGMNRWRGNLPSQSGSAASAGAIQGGGDYSQAEVQRQRSQNTAEENAILKRMAERLLAQQRSVAGSPELIRPLFPERGQALLFERLLQVSASSDLSVQLELAPPDRAASSTSWHLLSAVLLFLAALFIPLCFPRERRNAL